MKILIGNCNRQELRDWYAKGYSCGTLISAGDKAINPPSEIPYALDNGAFGCFLKKQPFDDRQYRRFLEKWFDRATKQPDWLLVPDCVGDRNKTLEMWEQWYQELKDYDIPLAFAVQDGMTKDDVPPEADIVFVGGTTNWKLGSIAYWTKHFKRVHVGRVNGWKRLWLCYWHGVESVDGTGFFRGGIDGDMSINLQTMLHYIKHQDLDDLTLSSFSPSQRRFFIQEINQEYINLSELPLFQSEIINFTLTEKEVLLNWLEGVIDCEYENGNQIELRNNRQLYQLIDEDKLQRNDQFIYLDQIYHALTCAMDNLQDCHDDDINEAVYGASAYQESELFLRQLESKLFRPKIL